MAKLQPSSELSLGLDSGLGLPVLAEGVETDAEFRFLRDEHCDAVQGYLLGRPAPIATFRNFTHDEVALRDQPASRGKVA